MGGGGIRVDTRTKTVEEQYGGICDPMGNQREEPCNSDDCPAIHCVWNDWVSGECSATCGVGSKVNTRTKLVEEANGGSCTGQFTETEECNLQECPGSNNIEKLLIEIRKILVNVKYEEKSYE